MVKVKIGQDWSRLIKVKIGQGQDKNTEQQDENTEQQEHVTLVGPVVAFLFQTSLFFQIDDEFVFVQLFQRVHLVVVAQQQLQFTPQRMKAGQACVFRSFVFLGDNFLVLAFDAREQRRSGT